MYERIAMRVKEIWQKLRFWHSEDRWGWRDVLSNIKSIIIPLPDIEKTRNKVKRISPAKHPKANPPETETMPELADEIIDVQVEEIRQQNICEPTEDEQNLIEAEDSNVNQSETIPELTPELIAERAKQIWRQHGCIPDEDERNWAEAEAQLKDELKID